MPQDAVAGPGTFVRMYFTAVGHGMSPVMFRYAHINFFPDQELEELTDSLHGLVIVCPSDETFGDVDGNGFINVSDIVFLIQFVFAFGDRPQPIVLIGDADCSGFVNVSDIVHLIGFVFGDGPPPCNPCD
jgi:hypothetical protein